jgi:cellobiose phosphorylase
MTEDMGMLGELKELSPREVVERYNALAEENKRLREALKPFADIAGDFPDYTDDQYKNTMAWAVPSVGCFRRARAALEQTGGA